jgi:hypothetical protein
MLDDCSQTLAKSEPLEAVVCRTLELSELKLATQKRQMESLVKSLRAADEQARSRFYTKSLLQKVTSKLKKTFKQESILHKKFTFKSSFKTCKKL